MDGDELKGYQDADDIGYEYGCIMEEYSVSLSGKIKRRMRDMVQMIQFLYVWI